jgi:hypothetical protein
MPLNKWKAKKEMPKIVAIEGKKWVEQGVNCKINSDYNTEDNKMMDSIMQPPTVGKSG